MVLLHSLVLKNISYFLRIFYLGTISMALPLLTLEPQNVFRIGMGSLYSSCNL